MTNVTKMRVGRPKGIGPYGESTKPMRIPVSMLVSVKEFLDTGGYKIPLYSSRVQAGAPSLADDNIEDKIDLREFLIQTPDATFMVRATGESMIGAGINEGDVLIVDRSIEPSDGKIVIAAVNGQLTVKRLKITHEGTFLLPENKNFLPIELKEGEELHIWGVVTKVIHEV